MRFWEIDFIRGIAIILMVIFNWSYTLKYFNIFIPQAGWIFWFLFPRFIAGLFIFIAGISLVLSYNHIGNIKLFNQKNIKRGLKIFGLGLLITLATWLLFPNEFIIFGILHLIGLSIILAIPFMKFEKLNLILGSIIFVAGLILQNFTFDFPWLLWLGFYPTNMITFDYFPLLPWFGIILIGIYFGKLLYKNNKRTFKISDLSNYLNIKFVSFLGKNSLLIYLLHQPLIILILLLFGFL